MADDFVTICEVCTKGITKPDLKFANGVSFHNQCFTAHGKEYPAMDYTLQSNTSRAKVELIQLKNLKFRLLGESNKTVKTTKRKPAKKTSRKTKRPVRKTVKTTKRKPAKKTSRKTKRPVRKTRR